MTALDHLLWRACDAAAYHPRFTAFAIIALVLWAHGMEIPA